MNPLILVLIAAIFFIFAVKITQDHEKMVIFRFGRFFKIADPGIAVIIPILDRGVIVNLDEKIPQWRGLPEAELHEKVKSLAQEQ